MDVAASAPHSEATSQRVAAVLRSKYKVSLLWELARGARRFGDLERALAPVTPKVLTRNLRDLESLALVRRRAAEGNAAEGYELAPLGIALRPSLVALCRWAYAHRAALGAGAATEP